MNVDVRSRGFPLASALSDHARRRLRFVLTRHSDRIRRVMVRLGDENGRRGGADKSCRIRVHLVDAPAVVIDDIGLDLYAVIDRAADRVGRAVVKHLDRSQNGRRPDVRAPPLAPFDELADAPFPAPSEGERA